MAVEADGTVVIDTEIRKENAIGDIGSLKAALRELTVAVKELTSGLTNVFTNFGSNATGAANNIDAISDSAKSAAGSVESLEEQMAKIHVENNTVGNSVPDDGVRRNVYGQNVDEIIDSNRELEQSTRQTTTAVEQEFQESEQAPSMLRNAIDMVRRTIAGVPAIAQMAGNGIRDGFANGEAGATRISDQVDRLKEHLYYLERQGFYFGDREYDKTYAALQRAEAELSAYRKQLAVTDRQQKNVASSGHKMNTTMRATNNEANPLAKSIFKLSNMFKLMLIRLAMRAVIAGAREAFQNLARYSDDTNKAISSLVSSMTQFKNSFAVAFAPILQTVAPILSKFISMIAEANNQVAQFMAALMGKDTYTKAIAVQEDYAASLKDTQKAAKDAADQAKKTTFSFDTLIQGSGTKATTADEYKAPTPDQMFKTVEVENEAKTLAANIKNTLSDLFKPIKDSWDQYGPYTTNAVKTMFASLKQLAADVGASFMKVWKDEGYGKAITDDLIITFGNFALIIANLATQFDKAWVNADTGTSIMRHLGDIVLEITGFFREASEMIKNWAANLDFGPLLKSFDNLLTNFVPIVSKIGAALLWFLDNVLLPLAKWAIEQALPAALDLISAALDFLDAVIDTFKPLALWLWEEFLKPLGQWGGEIIIAALKKVTEKLTDFSDWIRDHKQDVILITEYIVAFFAAWKVAEFVGKITTMISNIGNLGAALLTLVSRLDLTKLAFFGVVGAAAALVTGALEVYKNWDKMTPTEKTISMLILAAGAAAALAVASKAVIGPAAVALTVAAIAAGIAATAIAVNAGARSASKTNAYSSSSYPSSSYSSYSSNIPQLATGTVVPPRAGNFLAMLGDNNKDYEVVSPLETMKQAFKEAIGEMGGIGNGSGSAVMEIDGVKFGQIVYKYGNKENERIGPRMVITNGG